jgi:hypoxanthine phosphoribosyltransferase
MQIRHEMLSWSDVDNLIDHLAPQFDHTFDAMVMITRGGIVPAGLLAEITNIQSIYTASVDFPAEIEIEMKRKEKGRLLSWPKFIQFPPTENLLGQNILIVDDVWGSGRTITAVKNRLAAAAAISFTCVLHFNPYRNLFGSVRPDYFAAVTDAHIVYPWEIQRGREAILNQFDPRL